MSRRLFNLSSKRSASLALYGTLSLCTVTSFLSLTTDYSLQQAYKSKNKKDFDVAIERKKLLVDHATCSMRNLSEGRVYTLITSAFNHGSPMHFLGNMLGLWSFGQAIAFGFGARAFISLFYGGALTGNLACLSLDYYRSPKVDNDRLSTTTAQPANRNYVGSSGGVCAIACASACFNPWGMMIVGISFIPVPIPIWIRCIFSLCGGK